MAVKYCGTLFNLRQSWVKITGVNYRGNLLGYFYNFRARWHHRLRIMLNNVKVLQN